MKQIKYYYIRDSVKSDPNGLGRPVITVCLIEYHGLIARGMAICSNLDQPCKKVGREIATERACYALANRKDSLAINRFPYKAYTPLIPFINQDCGGFKSYYNPSLTKYEQGLFIARGIL